MTAREYLRENWRKHTDRESLIEDVHRETGTGKKRIIELISIEGLSRHFPPSRKGRPPKYLTGEKTKSQIVRKETISTAQPKKLSSEKYKGLNGLKKLFDKTCKIQNVIDTTLKDRAWMFDHEVREKSGISITYWRRYADQFAEFQRKAEGKTIWIHPEYIDEADEILN